MGEVNYLTFSLVGIALMLAYSILATDDDSRVGEIATPHGSIQTPSFVPVGTLGAMGAASVEDLRRIGSQVIITNAYHLHLRPGVDLIEKVGGLHHFMGWDGPLMTDSGGFQIFRFGAGREHGIGKIGPRLTDEGNCGRSPNLGKGIPLVNVGKEGVEFISYLDGSRHRFTPELVVRIGGKLGADILLPLDECTSPLHSYQSTSEAMNRTHDWAVRSLVEFKRTSNGRQALFGIIQGGAFRDLRERSAIFTAAQDFEGYAIGGSLGSSKEQMYRILDWVLPLLPRDKPRHLLGIGEIEDIFEIVRRGIDLFDCVLPTRIARTGTFLVKGGNRFRIHILNGRFKDDPCPIEEGCNCYTCSSFSRGYLRHLFMTRDPLAVGLATIHNLHFLEALMHDIRRAIEKGRFSLLRKRWLSETSGQGYQS